MKTTKILNGRVAIITGAARGIGLATVRTFAHEGASIVAFDLPQSLVDDAAKIAGEHGVPFLACHGDVASAADWQRVVSDTLTQFKKIDILVNNAGISGAIGSMLDYPDDVFDQVMAVNARGVFLGMKYVGQAMKSTGGAIVNISSVSGIGGGRYVIAYTASKHAVVGMTKLAAAELAQFKIRVNALCPAPTATEMMFEMERAQSPADPDAIRRGMSRMIPLGRYGEPDEIANAILFLASDAASLLPALPFPLMAVSRRVNFLGEDQHGFTVNRTSRNCHGC
ncbi:MAG: SDR family oxidoreductase [Gammaproteobacteria bacterium]|nr:SDR family oxidoreductase [Gammaproteobacteria bacterium]